MKARKHYENGGVMVYVSEGDWSTCLTFENEQQMKRMGVCLTDLGRIGGMQVSIGEEGT